MTNGILAEDEPYVSLYPDPASRQPSSSVQHGEVFQYYYLSPAI